MGFFSELKEDLSQAVNELLPDETEKTEETAEEITEETEVPQAEEASAIPGDMKSLEEMLENMDTDELFAGIKEEAGEDFFDEECELPELEEGSYFSQTLKAAVEEQLNSHEDDLPLEEEAESESLEDLLAAAIGNLPERTEEKLPAETELETAEATEMNPETETAEEVAEAAFEMTEPIEPEPVTEEAQTASEEVSAAEMLELLKEDGNLSTEDISMVVNEIDSLDEAVQVIEENEEKDEEEEKMNMDILPEDGILTEETALESNENTLTEEIGGFGMDSQLENKTAVDETAVITAGMTINGDMVSEGSVEVIGNIIGNIEILGKLNITGSIQGNSKAAEVYAENAKITGEIVSEGSVKIGQSSVIIGNISATSAVIAGAVKGDIDVHGPVILDTSAIVMGNIKSKSVQINNGAVIEGMCSQCYADVNPTSFFEDFKKSKNK